MKAAPPIGYYDQGVLASYRDEPDKWLIETDNFEGRLRISGAYLEALEEQDGMSENISIQFGYRAMADGTLALAVWLPDLRRASCKHLRRWSGFELADPEWSKDDLRFELWCRRYLQGDWTVENGSRSRLTELVDTVRGLTGAVLGIPLFKHPVPTTLSFPSAQNTRRYRDAHLELYGYLIDGLDKDCLGKLADELKAKVNVGSSKTVAALQALLPALGPSSSFHKAYSLVNEQRRLAAHEARSPALPFRAFERFSEDLDLCSLAIGGLLAALESALGTDGRQASLRWEALIRLPKIERPAEANYSICQASQMVGKSVAGVQFGSREGIEGSHTSEVLVITFEDGSLLAIDTGSNARNLSHAFEGLEPDSFHVDFTLHWVPPLVRAAQSAP